MAHISFAKFPQAWLRQVDESLVEESGLVEVEHVRVALDSAVGPMGEGRAFLRRPVYVDVYESLDMAVSLDELEIGCEEPVYRPVVACSAFEGGRGLAYHHWFTVLLRFFEETATPLNLPP